MHPQLLERDRPHPVQHARVHVAVPAARPSPLADLRDVRGDVGEGGAAAVQPERGGDVRGAVEAGGWGEGGGGGDPGVGGG